MAMKWTRGIIQRKTVWADGLFTLEVNAPEVAYFEPGQFLQLGLDLRTGHLHRPYSVASPHGAVLDFFIVLVKEGQLTPLLWDLKVGDSLDVSAKAAGSFTLKNCPPKKHLWLIGTGTGLAPYIAMLRCDQTWSMYQRIVLVHGVRYNADLAYQTEISDHLAAHPQQFSYAPVVSRESVEGALEGRITHCLTNGSLEATAQLKFDEDSCVMMCGNPDMLNETEKLLVERGLRKHKKKEPGNIVVERYW
jgi:ferredoxin--NADP+ reductase